LNFNFAVCCFKGRFSETNLFRWNSEFSHGLINKLCVNTIENLSKVYLELVNIYILCDPL
jgi:hypothetical protein